MITSSSYCHRQIRRVLRTPRADALSPRVRLLAHAVWNVQADRTAHGRCRAELPGYVDAEIEGHLTMLRGSFIHEHLRVCHRCAATYAELLEIALLNSQDCLPCPSPAVPDLSLLEVPND